MKNVNEKKAVMKGNYILLVGIFLILAVAALSPIVSSGVGATVITKTTLEVGNVFPEILNITVNSDSNIVLTPNATTTVVCQALIQDWNNDTDISLVNSTLYNTATSSWNELTADKVKFYSNSSCAIDLDAANYPGGVEDVWHATANCSFEVEYYSHPGDWNCSVFIQDSTALSNREEQSGVIDTMAAIGVQDIINYGTVDSTKVSNESTVNVTNVGNTMLNLTLSGYYDTNDKDSGKAMNCTKGSGDKTISLDYEKFNLTAVNDVPVSLSEFEGVYTNLTIDTAKPVRDFGLNYKQSEFVAESVKPTYWRIYVPKGLAGTCEGFIEFGGTVAVGI